MTSPAKRLRPEAGAPDAPIHGPMRPHHRHILAETPRNVEEVAQMETPRERVSVGREGGGGEGEGHERGESEEDGGTRGNEREEPRANASAGGETVAAARPAASREPPRGGGGFATTSSATTSSSAIANHAEGAGANGAGKAEARSEGKHNDNNQHLLRRGGNNANPFEKWDVGSRYKLIKVLGRGSYGEVCEGHDLRTEAHVAIKRIHNVFDLEIDTKRIVREVSILRQMKNDHVVRLLDIIPPKTPDFNELYLVFEFVETDLHKLILTPQYLSIDHVRYLLYQLLCAVKYIHSASVIHRDIKPANILLNEDCSLKLCDFGLSRVLLETSRHLRTTTDSPRVASHLPSAAQQDDAGIENPGDGGVPDRATPSSTTTTSSSSAAAAAPGRQSLQRQLTKHVVTRWYRPPELILLQEYSTPVDVWSIGCIFAELLSMQKDSVPVYSDRVPLFPGRSCFPLSADNDRSYKDQLDQLNVIFDVIGTPSEEDTQRLGEVRHYLRGLPKKPPKSIAKMYPAATPEAVDLLGKMLMFNPERRITVQEALAHPFLAGMRSTRREVEAERVIVFYDDMSMKELKEKLLEEIALYNTPSEGGGGAAVPDGTIEGS